MTIQYPLLTPLEQKLLNMIIQPWKWNLVKDRNFLQRVEAIAEADNCHIPEKISAIWSELSLETKLACLLYAAEEENWGRWWEAD